MLDDLLAALFGDWAIQSLRGRWIARIFVILAVASIVAAAIIVLG